MVSEKELEVWTNPTRGVVVVWKHNGAGVLDAELVKPGRTVHLTTFEKRLNQERAASAELDVFANGTLQPVRLIEGDPSEAASNPNWLSAGDMAALLQSHHKTFEKRVGEITNAATLERLLEVARDKDATVKQVELIRARLSAVSPTDVEDVTVHARGDDLIEGGIKAVTPR